MAGTDEKAAKLVNSGSVAAVADGLYQVRGSKKGTSYMVDMSDGSCECLGFRFRKDCAHIKAARMFENNRQVVS